MQKMRNEPNDIFCNQWLSVSSIALARVAGRRAAPEKIFVGLTGTAHENLAVTPPSTTRSCRLGVALNAEEDDGCRCAG
jgi:hypothetical protein